MLFEPLVFILLLAATAIGFLLGRHLRQKESDTARSKQLWLRQHYFEGLNHLINEQPDAAIDTFVATLEVNSETLETHFALGSLLRRRGEVERAIRVHQNLLARPSLSLSQQQLAQVELALDYMKSGLLDRAEVLFKELLESPDIAIRGNALERLVEIYRDEKEWQDAIAMAERLTHRKLGRNAGYWRELQAHFSCEIASTALQKRDYEAAREWVRKALEYDRQNIRARLALAEIDMSQDQWKEAVKVLEKIPVESPLYVSEALPLLKTCYTRMERLPVFEQHLQALYRKAPCESLLQQLAATLCEVQGEEAARAFIEQELARFPTLTPITHVLDMFGGQAGCRVSYDSLYPLLEQTLSERAAYECHHCGFVGQQLHWCCPSCKHWGTMLSKLAGTSEPAVSLP